jgi:hypothetical protein
MTAILTLPLVELIVTTGNNEDWIDSIQYLENDEITPVDLGGIFFAMEMRRVAADVDVVITASIDDGRLMVGGIGNSFLLINVPLSMMDDVAQGDYVADIVAKAEGYTRVVARFTITLFQGVTRWPLLS